MDTQRSQQSPVDRPSRCIGASQFEDLTKATLSVGGAPASRHGTADRWFVDETYAKVAGRWTRVRPLLSGWPPFTTGNSWRARRGPPTPGRR